MKRTTGIVSLILAGTVAPAATAGSHLWVINEVFSNTDGTIQFIEMKECCGAANEVALDGKWVESATTGNQFFFPENLPAGSTANKHLLLATQGFADLPDAPTPDYILQDGFFSIDGDTLTYWFYSNATLVFGPGELPLDGVSSLNRLNDTGGTFVDCNSPTNFAGERSTISAHCNPADLDGDGAVGVPDFLDLLAQWGPGDGCPPDLDGDGTVGVPDFLELLANWGPC